MRSDLAILTTSVIINSATIRLFWSNTDAFSAGDVSALESILSVNELAYASKSKSDFMRKRRILSRGLLREKLSQITGVAPAAVPLAIMPGGKPYLNGLPACPVRFSVACSLCWIIQAFCEVGDIGVDLEYVNPGQMTDGTVSYIMTDGQRLEWEALPQEQREAAFFRRWVCMESVLKAAGCGLQGLSSLRLEKPDSAWCQDRWWQVSELTAPPEFMAALAVSTQ